MISTVGNENGKLSKIEIKIENTIGLHKCWFYADKLIIISEKAHYFSMLKNTLTLV
jgi:hypothetical protein